MAKSEQWKALNLDLPQQQSFIRFYNNLPETLATTVRFFNRNDYYTVHGDNAVLVSKLMSIPLKYMGDQPKISYVCLNKGNFEYILRELLLVKQYRVEVYEKSNQGKNNNDWNLEYKGSPGNLTQFEDILFENVNIDSTNCVMAIKPMQNKVLAIGSVNITEGKLEVCEISDNESYSELESLLAQISPKECIVPVGESSELKTLKTVIERNGILLAPVKKSEFSSEDILQDLNRLLFFQEDQQRNAAIYKETNLKEALGCLQALIKFLNITGDERNFNQFKINMLDAKKFVRLDNAALHALHILPKIELKVSAASSFNTSAYKNSSLKGLLDHCVTSQGKRLLEQWLKQPLRDYNLINERLDIVQAFVKDSVSRIRLIKELLPRMVDLTTLSRKIACKKANLQDCYRVYQSVSNLPKIANILMQMEYKCIRAMLADPINDFVADLQNYQAMVEQTLDFDLVDRGEYFIKSSFDEGLNDLQEKKDRLEEKMQRELRLVAEDLDLESGKSIKLECNDLHGYFFRITLKDEKALRKRKNYIILDAIKGGVRFKNEKLSDLNQKYQNINSEYRQKQKIVADEIFEVAAGYVECLRSVNIIIATLDVLVSFATATVTARIPYVRPRLYKEGSGILNLTKLRHPCLEAQDNISFIANDARFHQNEKMLYVITGPNMCGKSTYIRSIGTCVLMAQIGCFVPCEEAEISLVDGILVRVGADDCQLKGLSTFMLEMIETSSIIKSSTQNSLVIIDELGRGTSTYDGCGIAWAIAEHLARDKKCFSLFATHFHEISRLAEEYNSVGNLHVTAITTEKTLTPLYQILPGECDKSYAIHCARLVGFPEDFIENAIGYQKDLEYHNGMKHIIDFEPTIKRKVISEGDAIIEEYLKKLKTENIHEKSDEELADVINNIKTSLLSQENLFVKGLLDSEN